ncbi:glycoside hydrolase family 28 protein [Salinimicrobium sp. HB62]|uniref:glycoside hydrolase family 28 protein n=1 Tax=Salinimicrobium sp. HB62 TaxID=3077781 RepID=UPI002D78F9A2|nr:glycoside hydrolase family 28 protein [Salinimicrobium sp. HB62]
MKKLNFKVTVAVLFLVFGTGTMEAQVSLEEMYEGLEFDMPRVIETSFPDYSRSITEFGAQAGGIFKNTEAFKKAISEVNSKGGGRVVIPRGIWLTGPIELKSNINLHLEDGALLLFSRDFDDYSLVQTSFEGLNTFRNVSPINANGVENIAITGTGTIDGNGDAWRPVKKSKMTANQWKTLLKSGGVVSDDGKMWFPSEVSKLGYDLSTDQNVPDLKGIEEHQKVKDYLRPVMVSIVNSNRILLDGPTFQNSPAWNIHPLMSEDIIIRNINVRNPWYSQNGDGLDLESCKNVLVYNNTFDVGDDAICFKSGKNKDGRDRGIPTENVVVKNNIVYHGHGGVVVGSEMSGGVKNVHISNCTFMGTDVGLRFKSTRGRGGVVENIYISDIDMINIPTEAIRFNLFYGGKAPVLDEGEAGMEEVRDETPGPVTEETPSFRNIYMDNIRVVDSHKAAFFMGLPEMNVKNIRLANSVLEAKSGITAIDADGLEFVNVKVISGNDAALTLYNTKNVKVEDFSFVENGKTPVRVLGKLTENVQFKKKDFSAAAQQIEQDSAVSKKAVSLK